MVVVVVVVLLGNMLDCFSARCSDFLESHPYREAANHNVTAKKTKTKKNRVFLFDRAGVHNMWIPPLKLSQQSLSLRAPIFSFKPF